MKGRMAASSGSIPPACILPAPRRPSAQPRAFKSAPAQKTPGTVERTTTQRVVRSCATVCRHSRSSRRKARPMALRASGRVRDRKKIPSLGPSSGSSTT